MMGTVHTDCSDEPCVEHPVHKTKLLATLLQHLEQAVLPSQQKAVSNFCAAEAAKCAAKHGLAVAAVCTFLSYWYKWTSSVATAILCYSRCFFEKMELMWEENLQK